MQRNLFRVAVTLAAMSLLFSWLISFEAIYLKVYVREVTVFAGNFPTVVTEFTYMEQRPAAAVAWMALLAGVSLLAIVGLSKAPRRRYVALTMLSLSSALLASVAFLVSPLTDGLLYAPAIGLSVVAGVVSVQSR
jgi:hypothetical protein